jgi:hypothetical protein
MIKIEYNEDFRKMDGYDEWLVLLHDKQIGFLCFVDGKYTLSLQTESLYQYGELTEIMGENFYYFDIWENDDMLSAFPVDDVLRRAKFAVRMFLLHAVKFVEEIKGLKFSNEK